MFRSLWAKSNPYKSLICHMVDAGQCAKAFLSEQSSAAVLNELSILTGFSPEKAICFASYIASLHDIGKAIPSFQKQNPLLYQKLLDEGLQDAPQGKRILHEYASAGILYDIWTERGEPEGRSADFARILSLHHQRSSEMKRYHCKNEQWQILQHRLEEEINRIFLPPPSLPVSSNISALCMLLEGIIILSDWIASSGPFNKSADYNDTYPSFSKEIALKAVTAYGVASSKSFAQINNFSTMWPSIKQPRALQIKCDNLDVASPLTIIEAPMGEGKTEAALYFAGLQCNYYRKRGVYVALPTQATSNQMFERVEKLLFTLGDKNPRLLHGMAFLKEDSAYDSAEDESDAQKWLRPLRMGMLEENAIGTVDQSMSAVLRSKFSVLRLLGLTTKVLVIDELHAYDAYMSEIIAMLLKWCKALSIPVILLSATLQQSQRLKYLSCYTANPLTLSDAYPLITQVSASGKLSEYPCEASKNMNYLFKPVWPNNQDEVADTVLNIISEGGCICVLVNTVSKAQEIYKAIRSKKDESVRLMLFHARFPYRRRKEIEEECLKLFGKAAGEHRPKKAILVATQVVEQSLDIDFDSMISELAPVDLLLQRAGRVHRHSGRIRPEKLASPVISVICPAKEAAENLDKRYGSSGFVYAPFLLYNTEQLLKHDLKVDVPSQVRSTLSKVYDIITPEAEQSWQKLLFSKSLMGEQAKAVEIPPPVEEEFSLRVAETENELPELNDGYESAMNTPTRLGESTMRIAFLSKKLYDCAVANPYDVETIQQVYQNSVSMHLPKADAGNVENLYEIPAGKLKGCFITDNDKEAWIEPYHLVNDYDLGIVWEE